MLDFFHGMQRAVKTSLSLALLLLGLAARAANVTPELLDVDRNPAQSLQRAEQVLARAAGGTASIRERLNAHLLAAQAAATLGTRKLANEHLLQTQQLARQLDDNFALAMAQGIEAGALADKGEQAASISAAENAFRLASTLDDELSQAYARETAAWALTSGANRYAQGEPHFAYALAVYKRAGHSLRMAAAQAGMATIYDGVQDAHSASESRRLAHDLLAQTDAPYLKSWLEWALGQDAVNAADAKAAQRYFQQSLNDSLKINDPASVAAANLGLGMAAVLAQNWAAAERYLAQAQPVLLEREYIALWTTGQGARARAWVGLHREGFEELLNSVKDIDSIPDSLGKMRYLEYRADAYLAAGMTGKAANTLKQVLAVERRLSELARKTQLTELGVRYEVGKKEEENATLRLKDQLNQASMRERSSDQRLLLALLSLAVVTLAFAGYFLVTQIHRRQHYAKLALQDVLTGAPNRRAILAHLESLAQAHQTAMVMMLDIDFFKHVNDKFGHDVGDNVLKAFYQAAAAALPAGERIGRLGGEEWLVVTQTQTLDVRRATDIFQSIRSHLQHSQIAGIPAGEKLTFSMGVSQLHAGATVADVLAAADRALYTAKHDGRDRLAVEPVVTAS